LRRCRREGSVNVVDHIRYLGQIEVGGFDLEVDCTVEYGKDTI